MTRVLTIVAAAVKVRLKDPNGKPVELVVSALPPARHHTIMHPLTLAGLPIIGPDDQGFLDSEGRFCDRRQAHSIAGDSGQIAALDSVFGERLFSEDLW